MIEPGHHYLPCLWLLQHNSLPVFGILPFLLHLSFCHPQLSNQSITTCGLKSPLGLIVVPKLISKVVPFEMLERVVCGPSLLVICFNTGTIYANVCLVQGDSHGCQVVGIAAHNWRLSHLSHSKCLDFWGSQWWHPHCLSKYPYFLS